MKKALIIGALLLFACVYIGVPVVQADETAGVMWGIVTYFHWQHNYPQDRAGIFYTDYTWTGCDDTISGALPHKYWIVNNLPSYYYRVGIYVLHCDKMTYSAPFWYQAGSEKRLDMLACVDSYD